MNTLQKVLEHLGYDERPQQALLFKTVRQLDQGDAIVQAGTGVGKSLAVLSAAVDVARWAGRPSLVVAPTNILLDQYADKDAPAVEAALGVKIRPLKGRAHYLCDSAPGWMDEELARRWAPRLHDDDIVEVDDSRVGCPGSEECDPSGVCHYRRAKEDLADADVIVTNAHLMVIDWQIKDQTEHDVTKNPLCTEETECMCGARLFPPLAARFVDEAHTLEEVLRGFVSRSINSKTTDRMGPAGEAMTRVLKARAREQVTAVVDGELVQALVNLAAWRPAEGQKNQRMTDTRAAARFMLAHGQAGRLSDGTTVLWMEPTPDREGGKLVAAPVSVAGMAGAMFRSAPFALVSATIPSSMASALGVTGTRALDVGHPFDYARQGRLGVSLHAGDYRSSQAPGNPKARAEEVYERVVEVGGGALLLFSSFRDLEAAYAQIGPRLRRGGLTVLRQERGADKRALGDSFKRDGNAVLFASKSFATGFDAPKTATSDPLRLVVVWKLPYPGSSPLIEAIRRRSWKSYEDMMLVDLVQAAGRLIRTEKDAGTLWIADARARTKLGDQVCAHLREFQMIA